MSDSDFSDLTEIDDEEDVPLSQVHAGRKKGDADSYRIRGALTAPRATSYTTQALHGECGPRTMMPIPNHRCD